MSSGWHHNIKMCTSSRGQRFSVTPRIQKPQQSPLQFLKPKPCMTRRQQAASLSQQLQTDPLIPLPRGKESRHQKVPSLHSYLQNTQPWGHTHMSGAWAFYSLLEPFLRSLPTLSLEDVISVSPLWMMHSSFFNFFFSFYWCRPFFKSLLKFIAILFLFYVLVFWPCVMWDLIFLTRDWTCTPCAGRQNLHPWPTREVPEWCTLKIFFFLIFGCPGSLLLHMGFLSLQWEGRGRGGAVVRGMGTHTSVLVWRIPQTEEPSGLQSTGSQRVRHNCGDPARTHTDVSLGWLLLLKSVGSRVWGQ